MPYSLQVGTVVVSLLMTHGATRLQSGDGTAAITWRGRKSRFVLGLGGIAGLAMIMHNILFVFSK